MEELASWAKRAGIPAAALTDTGNIYGWEKWVRLMQAAGVRPLLGCEVEAFGRPFLFLVKDCRGYPNLMEILNSREIRSAEGLVVVLLPRRQELEPPSFIRSLVSGSRGELYVGGEFSNLKAAFAWGKALNLPLVWANPLKFVCRPERLILLRSFAQKTAFPPEWKKWKRKIDLFGPRQESLALSKFGREVKPLYQNTFKLAEKCSFSFENIVPPLPADLFPVSLREEVFSRLRRLKNIGWKERERARRELEAVETSGFAPYFQVVHDVVAFARKRGILHNLKGSGASSYLAYLLGISWVDPLGCDLYFERFLNSGRAEPPDFDLDFESGRRDEVLAYVLEKYGRGRTGAAFVCSLKNYRARSAVYETARAFGFPPQEARSLSKRLPLFSGPEVLKENQAPPGAREIWRTAASLKDVYRETSLHVGGVILTPAPVSRCLPLEDSVRGYLMSHFDRDAVERLKLIKLDLLSVRGLSAISEAKKKLGLRYIPSGDKKTFRLLQEARTVGCFQVESPGMMNLLRRMRPETVFDLTQALALIRPGPTESGMKEMLLKKRQGKNCQTDNFLAGLLPETDGILLYEEQVMQLARRVAGMHPEEGESLRRAFKKKVPSELKKKFFEGAGKRGYSRKEIEKLWGLLEAFSSYSFNKAHSASYAAMAYQSAYLKAHHPVVYLAAVLNAGGGYYRPEEYIEEAKRMGIRILGVDVNRSRLSFWVEKDSIRVGFLSVKGLGQKAGLRIIRERQDGLFLSVEDFLGRVSLSKPDLLSLIKAGAFDSLEPRRTRQVLRYFQGIEDMEGVADFGDPQKRKMEVETLGFSPEGDMLSLLEKNRPPLRIKDLRAKVGREVELVLRVVDARLKRVGKGEKYFYLFEDETGILDGVGERKCLSFGHPPVCRVKGTVRKDGSGGIKLTGCLFAGRL